MILITESNIKTKSIKYEVIFQSGNLILNENSL